jgi:hypothetical protein
MRRRELIRLNKELDEMAQEDERSTYDSLSPSEKELLEVNKQLDQIAPHQRGVFERSGGGEQYPEPSDKPKTKKARKRKSPKPLIQACNETSSIEDSEKHLLLLQHQALANQAEAAKGNTKFGAGLVLASFLSVFIPGFFGMGLVLIGVTYYMYYKAEKKQKEYEKSAEEIRVRLATLHSQD